MQKNFAELKNILILIQENIIKTGFIPDNFEELDPWIEIISFIETNDKNPKKTFRPFLDFLDSLKLEDLFSNVQAVSQIIEFLRKEMRFKIKIQNANESAKLTLTIKNIVTGEQTFIKSVGQWNSIFVGN